MHYRLFTLFSILAAFVGGVCAQARFSADTRNYTFGQIEWKHPVTARFVVTNTGTQPLVLSEVEPDCACTLARWTQTPIPPGERGEVCVAFDAEALGHFHKSVAVYTNAGSGLERLYFSGQVVREITDFTKTHPYRMGDILIDRNEIVFPDVQHGERPSLRIGVANLSARYYEPVLMHLPAYLHATAEPPMLAPGEKGVITLSLDTERLSDLGLTQATVYLSRQAGDKVGEENELPLSVVLLPDFSDLTASQRANAPAITLSAEAVDLTTLPAKKSKARQDIIVTNTGRSDLHISKLQVFHPAVGVSLKKSLLKPGQSTRLRVTVDRHALSKKHRRLSLLMITDDPARPKVEIAIKAE